MKLLVHEIGGHVHYSWENSGNSKFSNCGPPPGPKAERTNENQFIFIRGYTIAKKEPFSLFRKRHQIVVDGIEDSGSDIKSSVQQLKKKTTSRVRRCRSIGRGNRISRRTTRWFERFRRGGNRVLGSLGRELRGPQVMLAGQVDLQVKRALLEVVRMDRHLADVTFLVPMVLWTRIHPSRSKKLQEPVR
jgi:hypothetical protein